LLKILFTWLDAHHGAYWVIALGPTLLLGGWILSAGKQEARGPVTPRPWLIWLDAIILFLFLFAWRWPFLLVANEFNPDESQLIAGAITLSHDPIFWRSVDGATSGPLNFYALLPLHWLGLPLDYFTARLTGLLLIGGALFACHRALANAFGRAPAWVSILPATAFFATVSHTDLIHFSTEHLPLFIIGLCFWLLTQRPSGDRYRLWLACFLAGSLCWAKLQGAPIALTLIGWGCWQIWQDTARTGAARLRQTAWAGLAAATPSLLILTCTAVTGQTATMLHRYFLNNIFYVEEGYSTASNPGLPQFLQDMVNQALSDGRFPLLIGSALASILAGIFFLIIRRVRPPQLFLTGAFLTAAAVIAIVTPHRGFLHYALWLPLPLTFWLGAAVGGWWGQLTTTWSRALLYLILIISGGLLPLVTRGAQPVPYVFGKFSEYWRYPHQSVAVIISALAGKEDCLGIWGWANNFYVDSNLPQATREANSVFMIWPGENQKYYRASYLSDLHEHRPAVFIDAVGPESFHFTDRIKSGHEIFPELDSYIRKYYTLVADLTGSRIYARNDLSTLPALTPSRLNILINQGRQAFALAYGASRSRLIVSSAPFGMSIAIASSHPVLFAHAPAALEFTLDASMRTITGEFGLLDGSWNQRNATKGQTAGIVFIAEQVAANGQVTELWRQILSPAQILADRDLKYFSFKLAEPVNGRLRLKSAAAHPPDNSFGYSYWGNLIAKP
jgi:hypothetical protein